MGKEAFVIPRSELEKNSLIPEQLSESYTYTRIKNFGDLRKLLRVSNQSGKYCERYGDKGVETNPSIQQIIMYGFVQKNDGSFLLYQRGREGQYSESRLASKVSVGIGGHMEPTDLTLAKSFYRELDEEAEIIVNGEPLNTKNNDGSLNLPLIKKYIQVSPIGIIKDERDDVGKVHVGIACKITLKDERNTIRIRTEDGENVYSSYVSMDKYSEMQEKGQIEPEGWTNILAKEELTQH